MSAAVRIERPTREALTKAYRNAVTDHIRAHTKGTNVNRQTLLTTDYLNHFSEVVMMLELMPTAPAEMAADLASWQHQTYEEHFAQSGFRDKSLAIAAYRNAPEDIRYAFDMTVADLEQETVICLREAEAMFAEGDRDGLVRLTESAVPRLQDLIGQVAGIINGGTTDIAARDAEVGASEDGQAKIDAIFG